MLLIGLVLGFVGGWMLASYFTMKLVDTLDEMKASALATIAASSHRSASH